MLLSTLRTPYAMSGTDLGCASPSHARDLEHHVSCPICLRACYAMSGTDLAYAATRHTDPESIRYWVRPPICLRVRYAVSGSDVAYGATAGRDYGPTRAPRSDRFLVLSPYTPSRYLPPPCLPTP
eukprot:3933334-Rhodomonas_salina.2